MRFVVLDAFRFIAALAVLLHHFRLSLSVDIDAWTPIFARGQMFVDFFFILSGFVIYHTYADKIKSGADYGRYLQKRFARIYPLHFLTLMFYVCFALALDLMGMQANKPERYAWEALWSNLLLVQAWGTESAYTFNSVSWSLSAEFFVYLLFPVVVYMLAQWRLWGTLLAALGLVLLMQGLRSQAGLSDWTQASVDYGQFRALPSFILGACLSYAAQRRQFAVSWWWVPLAALWPLTALHTGASDNWVVAGFGALTFATIHAELTRPVVLGRKTLETLGDASYSLYMLHPLFKTLLLTMGKYLLKLGPMAMNAMVILATLLSLISAVLCFRWIETPARRWLSRPLGKATAPSTQATGK